MLVTHFMLFVSFYTSWKHQQTSSFLFSGEYRKRPVAWNRLPKNFNFTFFRAVSFIFNSKMTKSEGESRPYLCKVDISDIEKRKYPTKYYVSEAKTSLTAFSRLLLKPGPSKTWTLNNLDPKMPLPWKAWIPKNMK